MNLFEFVQALNDKARHVGYGGPTIRYRIVIDHGSDEPSTHVELQRDGVRAASVRVSIATGTIESVVADRRAPIEALRHIESVVPEGVKVQ